MEDGSTRHILSYIDRTLYIHTHNYLYLRDYNASIKMYDAVNDNDNVVKM